MASYESIWLGTVLENGFHRLIEDLLMASYESIWLSTVLESGFHHLIQDIEWLVMSLFDLVQCLKVDFTT